MLVFNSAASYIPKVSSRRLNDLHSKEPWYPAQHYIFLRTLVSDSAPYISKNTRIQLSIIHSKEPRYPTQLPTFQRTDTHPKNACI